MNRLNKVELALQLALNWLIKYEPPDSRAVSNEFVAMAAISCGCDNEKCIEIIQNALEGK